MHYKLCYKSTFRILSKGRISLVVSALLLGTTISHASLSSNALPSGGNVISGQATIANSANTMNIHQSTNKAIINWSEFNIGRDATVNFNQPSSSSSTLNRVIGSNGSEIYGKLNANGKIYLINPRGILFGQGSQVNVGSLVASTMNIKDQDYLNDNPVFTRDGATGKIENYGEINAQEKGYIALLAPSVINEGVIRANMGSVALAGGEKVTLNFDGTGLVNITTDKATINTLIENKKLIVANGGRVYLSAQSAGELLSGVVKNSGHIEANTLSSTNGKVMLDAQEIEVSGMITAKGGEIYVGNKEVEKTTLKAGATLESDFVETSARKLTVEDGVGIKAKEWLLDPENITIQSSGSTTDLTGSSISATLIENTLNGGTGVTLIATNDITINQALSWNQSLLTLQAANDLNIFATLTPSGTASLNLGYGYNGTTYGNGTSAVRYGLYTDTAFSGKVDFGTRTGTGFLTINGNGYDVVNDLSVFSAKLNSKGTPTYVAMGSNIDDAATGERAAYVVFVVASDTTFDGLGNSISNLNFNFSGAHSGANWGFIAENSGTVKNLGIHNLSISGNTNIQRVGFIGSDFGGDIFGIKVSGTTKVSGNSYIGSIVGSSVGILKEFSLTGDISVSHTRSTGFGYTGGAVGGAENLSTIQYGYSDADLTTDNPSQYITLGGFVGAARSGSVSLSHLHNAGTMTLGDRITTGTVTVNGLAYAGKTDSANGTYGIGGIVGELGYYSGQNNTNVVLSDSSFSGTISVGNSSWYVGGLAGFNHANILDSEFSGTLTTGTNSKYIGGIAGANYHATNTNPYAITNSIFSGAITTGSGSQEIGGFAGRNGNQGQINSFISQGTVSAGDANSYIGGVVGRDYNPGTVNSGISDGYSTSSVTRNGVDAVDNKGLADPFLGKLVGNGGVQSNVFHKTPVTYEFAEHVSSTLYGTGYTLPSPIFTGGTVTGTSDVKVYDSNNVDVTASATAGTLQTGMYTVKVATLTDNAYAIAGSGNTDLTLNVNAPISYTLPATASLQVGTAFSFPTPTFGGGTPDSYGINIYDGNGNSVKGDALGGTLSAGIYYVRVSNISGNYMEIAPNGNTQQVLTVSAASSSPSSSSSSSDSGGSSTPTTSSGGDTTTISIPATSTQQEAKTEETKKVVDTITSNLPRTNPLVTTPIATPTFAPTPNTPLTTPTGAQGTTVEIKTLRAETPASAPQTGEAGAPQTTQTATETKTPIVLEVARVGANIDTKLITLVKNDVAVSVENPIANQPQTATINAKVDTLNGSSTFIIPPSTVRQAGIADNSQVVEVKMANGAPLPEWLKVDPVSMAVQLDNPPTEAQNGAEVRITLKEPGGTVKTLVVKVSEAGNVEEG